MKLRFTFLMLVAALLVPWASRAQSLGDYTFTTGTDATKWVTLTAPDTILTPANPGSDGKASTLQDIGFSFPFASSDYTKFSVNTDGNLRLGSTLTGTGNYSSPFSVSNSVINNPKINFLGCDGYMLDTGAHRGCVLKQNFVDAGDSMLVVEFATSTFNSTSRQSLLRWQVQLHNNGNILVVYHSVAPPIMPNVVRQPGMCVDGTDVVLVNATHEATHYTAGQSLTIPTGNWPDTNRYYSFEAPVVTCARPHFTVSDITASSANINITPGGSENSWAIRVNDGDWMPVMSTTYSLSNLSMGSRYRVEVVSICASGDTSFATLGEFVTLCDAISSMPFTEDFEDCPYYLSGATAYADAMPYCWTRINDATGTINYYPYINTSSTYLIHGAKSMYWYHTTTASYSDNQYAVLPPVDATLYNVSDLTMSFYAKTTATAAPWPLFIVGVMDDPDSVGSFVPVDTITLTNIATLYVVDFANYTGNGTYIAIHCPRPTAARYCSLDDIFLTDDWCDAPENVTVANVTSDEVTLSWEPNGGSSFTVIFGDNTIENVSDTFYTFTGLTPNTYYDYSVATECTTLSLFINGSVHTACEPVPTDSLPYVEDFETYSSGSANPINSCWSKAVYNTTTQYPYPSTTAAITGGIGLYFYGSSSSSISSYAALPLFESDLTDLMVSFYLKRYTSTSSSYHTIMQVGVMTDPSDISTFELVNEIDMTNLPASSIERYQVSFEGYTGSGQYIAFYAPAPAGTSQINYASLDSVVVAALPNCRWPVNLAVSDVSAYEVDLTWSGSAAAYEVEYSTTHDFAPATTTSLNVNDTTVAITGLTQFTPYWFRVRSVCGNETSDWSLTVQATTPVDCGPNGVNILDTLGTGSSATSSYAFCTTTSYRTGYSSSIYTAQELNDMGIQINNRINGISLHSGATGGTIRHAKVYVAETTLEGYGTPVANDTTDRNTMTLVYSGDLVVPTNSWVDITFDTPFVYSGNNNLLISLIHDTNTTAAVSFYYTSTSPNYLNCYGYRSATSTAGNSAVRSYNRPNMAFNICTEIPTCLRPTYPTTVGISDTSATITWTGDAANYEVAVHNASIDPDSVTPLITLFTSDDTVTVTGLAANTTYYFYIRSLCGSIGNSEWSLEGTFTTACTPMSLPYTEDFEAYSSGSTYPINECWTKGTNSSTAYPYPFSTNAINGQRSLYFYAYHPSSATTTAIYSYAALPMFQDSVKNLMLSFNVRRYSSTTDSYTSRLVVGVMTNPDDITTFFPMDTIDLKNESSLSVHGYEFFFNNYTGDGQYIAIYDEVPPLYGTSTSSYSYVYVDDVLVDRIPSCMRPTNVTVNNITPNSATVHWTSAAPNFDIEYGPAGFTQGTGNMLTSTVDSVDLAGLAPGTGYDVYVRARCSATDSSNWSFAYSFYTACGLFALPYSEDFENYGSGAAYDINPCWIKGTNGSTAYPYPSSSNAVTGQRSLYFYAYHPSSASSTSIYSYTTLPEFAAPVNTLELTFNMRRYSTTGNTYTSLILVGVMSNPNDINTFVAVDSIDLHAEAGSSIHEINVSFAGYTGTGTRIALLAPVPPLYGTGTYTYNYCYIDDIYVAPMSPCPRAFDLTATNATQSSVDLGWTDTIGSTQWTIAYAPMGDTNWTELTTTTNPYTLTGLTPNSTYRFRVAPLCSDGNQAEWSRQILVFTTSQVPATIPYAYNFEDPAEWANWQTSSNSMYNWYRGNAAQGSNNTYSLYLSADSGATHSWSLNTVTNAVAYRDINFGPDPHSFEVEFDAYMGGTIAHNYDGISVLLVEPSVPVVSVNTNITSPWGNVNDVSYGTVRHDTLWGHHSVYLDNVSGVKRLVFYHFNQSTGSNNDFEDNPPAIDNINVTMQLCDRPVDLTVSNVQDATADFTWVGEANALYQVSYRVQGAPASTNIDDTVRGTFYHVTGLTPSTSYYCWVRKICSMTATDTVVSSWSVNSAFTTLCVPISVIDTLFEDFESITPVAYNATGGQLPDCWDSWSSNGAAIYPHVTDSGTYSYCISGRQAITMTSSGSSANYGLNSYVSLPNIVEPTNSLALAFWFCVENRTEGTLSVGYLTGNDYNNDFVVVKTMVPNDSAFHSGNGIQRPTRGQRDTIYFDSVPAGNYPIVFRWNKESTFYSVCIDDVAIWSTSNCFAPAVSVTNLTYQGADITAVGTGIAYELAYGTDNAALTDTVTSATGLFTLTGLTPSTQYFYAVRQQCDSVEYSIWSVGNFNTDSLPCSEPTGLTVVNTTYNSAELSWTSTGNATNWVVSITAAGETRYDTVSTNPYTITGLYADQEHTVMVMALCGGGVVQSGWSEPLSFTTDVCTPVSGVTVTDTTATSVKVNWNAVNGSMGYKLYYGAPGFYEEEAATAEVGATTTSYVINGLNPETPYEVYVLNRCTETLYSNVTADDRVPFTTLSSSEGIYDVESGTLTLYPNPASEKVTVTVTGFEGTVEVEIVDMNGRRVAGYTTMDSELTINVSDLAQGAYFVRVTGDTHTAVRKLIVK